jgi:NAD(P)H-hydrate epimerase
MTVGGTGDVLAGATGALLAVLSPIQAAALGAYANGLAGDRALEDTGGYGLVPTDLLDGLPAALWGDRR